MTRSRWESLPAIHGPTASSCGPGSPLARSSRPGGWATGRRDVEWQIAADPAMTRVVRHGQLSTRAEFAHSVHVTVDGLQPGRDYWYRFRSGRWLSPIARTKTAPASRRTGPSVGLRGGLVPVVDGRLLRRPPPPRR